MGTSQDLYKKAKTIIPGGSQLLSKRPEMFLPDLWPAYYSRAKGCEVWDLDGNKFVDMCFMGIGSCIIGYADDEIDDAVKESIGRGVMATLNAPEEVELAELLLERHPWADMVRYARTGGEAMSVAVRIARARTGKELVLFCGYHGWHDWYLSANLADSKSLDDQHLPGLSSRGLPRGLKGTTVPFSYNDVEGFLSLVKNYGEKIAAIVIEPVRNMIPRSDFLQAIQKSANSLGVPLIIDEITAGWRLVVGGAHLTLDLTPDVAVFAKGMSNGYPMAAIIGKRDTMDFAQNTFISSTYWTDRTGPTAAIASIRKMIKHNIPNHLVECGRRVKNGWKELARKHGINIHIDGMDPLGHFAFEYENNLEPKTLFTQIMLEEGFLASTAYYASFAHKGEHIEGYLRAADKAFEIISDAIKKGNVRDLLKGPVCQSGFKRLA